MAKPRTANRLLRHPIVAALFILVLGWVSAIGIAPAVRAQYGACNYSEGSFSQEDHSCDQPSGGSSSGKLGDTGENVQYLIFAAVGLLAGASFLIFIVLVLKKSKRDTIDSNKVE